MEIEYSEGEEIIQDSQTDETTPQDGEINQDEDSDAKITRYKEQLHGRTLQAREAEERATRAETMLVNNLAQRVEQDNGYLIELYNEDPDLAEKVAQQFGGLSAQEAIARVEAARDGNPMPPTSPTIDEDELFRKWEEKWEAKQRAKEIDSVTNKYFSKLSGDDKDLAIEKYQKLKGGKELTKEEAIELADLAIYAVTKESKKAEGKEKAILELSSTTLGSTTSDRPKNKPKVSGADELAKSMGLGYLYE